MAHVTVFGPGIGQEGRAVPLETAEFTLGREVESALVLDHREISRRHALLRLGPSGWEVHDLGSANGIRVQGHRVEAALLKDGDEVRLGPFRLVFAGDPVEAPSPPVRRPPPPPPPPAPGGGRASPRSPLPRRAGGKRFPLVVVVLGALVLLPSFLVGVVLLRDRRTGRPETTATETGPPEPTPAAPVLPDEPVPPPAAWPPPPDPAVRAEVDRAAASLEKALAAGNLEEAFLHVHPAAATGLRAAFEPRRADLPRVASLLSTRRLVVAEDTWAEYEVTESGRTYAVVFEKVEGRWLLSSL